MAALQERGLPIPDVDKRGMPIPDGDMQLMMVSALLTAMRGLQHVLGPSHAQVGALMAEAAFAKFESCADDDGTQAAAFRERTEREARTHGRIGGVGLGEAFRLMDPAS